MSAAAARRTVGNVYQVYSDVRISLFAAVGFGPRMFTVRVRLSDGGAPSPAIWMKLLRDVVVVASPGVLGVGEYTRWRVMPPRSSTDSAGLVVAAAK